VTTACRFQPHIVGLKKAAMRDRLSIITQDRDLAQLLSEPLIEAGHEVQVLSTTPRFWQRTRRFTSSLVLVDLDTMGNEALAKCRRLRLLNGARIMAVGVPEDDEDVVDAFRAGVDEYMRKPIGLMELVARVEVLLRRRGNRRLSQATRRPVCAGVTLDASTRTLYVRGRRVKLSPIECELLECLIRRAGLITPRAMLVRQVWGEEREQNSGLLNLYIHYLRRKIEEDPRHPKHILTKWGVGYYLASETPPKRAQRAS
jgi:DNA-binding response OmpR family regulator